VVVHLCCVRLVDALLRLRRYPDLVKHLRILIYNGDADACVPYKGNEQWVEELASQGIVESKKAWHPW